MRRRPFRVEVAKRIADLNALIGAPADAEVAASSRARIRTEVAKEFFRRRARPRPGRRPRARSPDRERLSTTLADGRRLRPDVLAGEVGLDVVGGRRPSVGGGDRAGARGRRRRCVAVHRGAGGVHPDRAAGAPAGQGPRPGRGRVHPPRQPGRRPGSAHPCRGREQGPDPRRTLAVDRRPGAVQSEGGRVGDLQHRPRTAPPRRARRAVRRTARDRSGEAADPGDRRR